MAQFQRFILQKIPRPSYDFLKLHSHEKRLISTPDFLFLKKI